MLATQARRNDRALEELIMLRVTYLDFRARPGISGWYITDANGAIVDGGRRYEDEASGLRALIALS
ncbi:hypothetical protein [Methylobacterium sp. OT2]|uniref:hypothetical protein n=1 Tax=Methylobacterium sp. OT2 TaxID=2813779 RepID=UPI00197B9E28|nr:hypothetical protein [Methylobacterium sp. OT2]MBN4095662.1 hypothetical protein [Methylobacterium sp. OT2]